MIFKECLFRKVNVWTNQNMVSWKQFFSNFFFKFCAWAKLCSSSKHFFTFTISNFSPQRLPLFLIPKTFISHAASFVSCQKCSKIFGIVCIYTDNGHSKTLRQIKVTYTKKLESMSSMTNPMRLQAQQKGFTTL